MKVIVNLLVQEEVGATPVEFAFLAAGISMLILFGLLLLGA
jgi:Flp pilus assembly pilin Flp